MDIISGLYHGIININVYRFRHLLEKFDKKKFDMDILGKFFWRQVGTATSRVGDKSASDKSAATS